MNKLYDLANYLLGESTALVGTPGTDIVRNDFGEKVLPHGFTADTTLLSDKEIEDAIIVMSQSSIRLLKSYKNQIEDTIETVKKLGQKNRLNDLKIRLYMAEEALKKIAEQEAGEPIDN